MVKAFEKDDRVELPARTVGDVEVASDRLQLHTDRLDAPRNQFNEVRLDVHNRQAAG